MSIKFEHVHYLWDEKKSSSIEGDEVALLVYRSNLLGEDLRITNYGGGNTSCKVNAIDPLSGMPTDVMWIKGSGGDLGSLTRSGLSALYLDRLCSLERVYEGITAEDKMVLLFNHCLFDLDSKAPSIDTPLHAFLPFKHIDHLHPDAAIAIAAAKDGKRITQELFKGTIGWVDWQRPGFDLGLQLRKCLVESPGIRGIMLGSHGLFTWGDTSRACYQNSLEVIETCAQFIESASKTKGNVFGGVGIAALNQEQRREKATQLVPILRGLVSQAQSMLAHFSDDERVMEFVCSNDLKRLAPMGTSCPDHFLRTKIRPLILDLEPLADLNDSSLRTRLHEQVEEYRKMYASYYADCRRPNSPSMRDANPVVILYPGIGMFTFAKDKTTARIASEFYINAINVMRGAESISSYTSLPPQEAFDIEYWLLEEAKLQRLPKPKPLTGKIAWITGSAGGIGKAIAKKFLQEGACVLLSDLDADRLKKTYEEFSNQYGQDHVRFAEIDVTQSAKIEHAISELSLSFGGCDIVVNSAGLSISKPIEEHTEYDWDLLYDVLVKGQFLVTRSALAVLRKQSTGGDIINIVSKNALVSGPNNAGYGSAKAAQLHLSRLNAAELGKDGIRVNTINPDAVIADSKIWEGDWAKGRAAAYGISVEELPSFYAKRTLLNQIILPEDIANACFALVGGLLSKSTGNTINVDGGISAAFLR